MSQCFATRSVPDSCNTPVTSMDFGEGGYTPSLDEFFTRFPVDERAYDYFCQTPPSVQEKVLQTFKAPREGESNYSGLFTTFVMRVRGHYEQAQFGMSNQIAIVHPQPGGEWFEATVTQWQEDRGFGFLQLDDGRRVYVHHTVFGGGTLLENGRCMTQVTDDPRNAGKFCAAAVQGPAVMSKKGGNQAPMNGVGGMPGSVNTNIMGNFGTQTQGASPFTGRHSDFQQQTGPGETYDAVVKEWVDDKGYGFLELQDGQKVYVHHTVFGGGSLWVGMHCMAQVSGDPRNPGKLCATMVQGSAVVSKTGVMGGDMKRQRLNEGCFPFPEGSIL